MGDFNRHLNIKLFVPNNYSLIGCRLGYGLKFICCARVRCRALVLEPNINVFFDYLFFHIFSYFSMVYKKLLSKCFSSIRCVVCVHKDNDMGESTAFTELCNGSRSSP